MHAVSQWRGLYAIVDPEHCAGRDPLAITRAVLAGGCAVLQLRDKRPDHGARRALAFAMSEHCRAAGVPFVVNDHVELAIEVGATGVHLGQGDLPIEAARALSRELIIGLSTHDVQQALAAQQRGADLIGFGPVFATSTKLNPDPVVGTDRLREVCAAVALPVVAIGGIALESVPQLKQAGAPLAAAISAVCAASDPSAAARALHLALREGWS